MLDRKSSGKGFDSFIRLLFTKKVISHPVCQPVCRVLFVSFLVISSKLNFCNLRPNAILFFQVVRHLWFAKVPGKSFRSVAFMRSKKRIAAMAVVVSVIYAICWVPTLVIYFLANLLPSESMYSVGHKTTIVLATLNSSINPIVYSLRSYLFRRNLSKLFQRNKKRIKMNRVYPGPAQNTTYVQN